MALFVFFGTLGMPLGDKHFKALRRAASNVLVGDHKHASSHGVVHYLTHRLQDPELYVISDLLTTLRRMFTYDPDLAARTIARICAFDGVVSGPPPTIAFYLQKLQWELAPEATLLGPGGLRINLRDSSTRQKKNSD